MILGGIAIENHVWKKLRKGAFRLNSRRQVQREYDCVRLWSRLEGIGGSHGTQAFES